MARGVVVAHEPELGNALRSHQKNTLTAVAKAIGEIKQYDFGGWYDQGRSYAGRVYFVPGDTLVRGEALRLGIRSADDLFGGVVSHPFAKTKAITHGLVAVSAERPDGWSSAFADRISDVVLPGFSVFSAHDARIAAKRMLDSGGFRVLRVKEPLHAGGRGQSRITTAEDVDGLLEALSAEEIATYGLVLEADLQDVSTLSVGQIVMDGLTMSYHGIQRETTNNDGQRVYGGTDLICVQGGWEALSRCRMSTAARAALAMARAYDAAMCEYPGFIASRRNYDVVEGTDARGHRRSGVLESSWRFGGASPAELAALTTFIRNADAAMVEAEHIEKFGEMREAPPDATVQFDGDDPDAGPMVRYTLVKAIYRNSDVVPASRSDQE